MVISATKGTSKFSKTYGFYLLENYFQRYRSWPTYDGFRGLGRMILVLINLALGLYPIIIEFSNWKMNINKCLLRLQFLTIGLTFVIVDALFLHRSRCLFELINVFSDFNHFGFPNRMKFVERIFKSFLKIANYIGFASVFLISYGIFFDEIFCTNVKWSADKRDITFDLLVAYYVPFNLKPWHQAVIVLFQIYSFIPIINILIGLLLLYSYMSELLTLRVEHLISLINSIRFKRNQMDNFKLKAVIAYYQDIYKLFQMLTKHFATDIIVVPKLCVIICAILSASGFLLCPNLPNFIIIILTFLILCCAHHSGQRLINAGDSIANAIYNLNWYDADLRTQKDVLTFLTISQRTLLMELPLFGKISHWQLGNEYKKVYMSFNAIYKISKNKSFT